MIKRIYLTEDKETDDRSTWSKTKEQLFNIANNVNPALKLVRDTAKDFGLIEDDEDEIKRMDKEKEFEIHSKKGNKYNKKPLKASLTWWNKLDKIEQKKFIEFYYDYNTTGVNYLRSFFSAARRTFKKDYEFLSPDVVNKNNVIYKFNKETKKFVRK